MKKAAREQEDLELLGNCPNWEAAMMTQKRKHHPFEVLVEVVACVRQTPGLSAPEIMEVLAERGILEDDTWEAIYCLRVIGLFEPFGPLPSVGFWLAQREESDG